jgi:hypothetical protein
VCIDDGGSAANVDILIGSFFKVLVILRIKIQNILRDYPEMAWHTAGECNNMDMRFRKCESLLIFY